MLPYKEVVYVQKDFSGTKALLAGDIGGTNSNFGIFEIQNTACTMLFSLHVKSKEVSSFADLIQDVLTYVDEKYHITITSACIAAAGVISDDRTFVKPTNLPLHIDTKEISAKTGLKNIFLVNDFEIIGYGLALINPKDIVLVNKGTPYQHGHKAIIGAGTGFGKCILYWNKNISSYVPISSEGGHADFPICTQQEFDLCRYIQNSEGWQCNVSWEDVLSGQGIQRIYNFFKNSDRSSKETKGIGTHGPQPDEIFKSRLLDAHCAHTFELYTKFYARCAKDFALDALALGGIYIAGGIAAKNLALFEHPAFMKEFFMCGKQQALLQNVPIYVITDYNISLYGAAQYMLQEIL